jgi:hypothetical protein
MEPDMSSAGNGNFGYFAKDTLRNRLLLNAK